MYTWKLSLYFKYSIWQCDFGTYFIVVISPCEYTRGKNYKLFNQHKKYSFSVADRCLLLAAQRLTAV